MKKADIQIGGLYLAEVGDTECCMAITKLDGRRAHGVVVSVDPKPTLLLSDPPDVGDEVGAALVKVLRPAEATPPGHRTTRKPWVSHPARRYDAAVAAMRAHAYALRRHSNRPSVPRGMTIGQVEEIDMDAGSLSMSLEGSLDLDAFRIMCDCSCGFLAAVLGAQQTLRAALLSAGKPLPRELSGDSPGLAFSNTSLDVAREWGDMSEWLRLSEDSRDDWDLFQATVAPCYQALRGLRERLADSCSDLLRTARSEKLSEYGREVTEESASVARLAEAEDQTARQRAAEALARIG